MPHYQLFVHQENKGLTYLEAYTDTYNIEKQQLLDQGFVVDGGHYIQAPSGAIAMQQYGDITTEALNNYAPTIFGTQGAIEDTSLYLWNSKALAKDIKNERLSEREWKNYYLAGSLIITLSFYVAALVPRENTLSIMTEAVLMLLIFILGINSTFKTHENNGESVANYVAKMIALLVPITIKIIALSFAVGFVIGIVEAMGSGIYFSEWMQVAISVIMQVIIFWRLNVHLQSINS